MGGAATAEPTERGGEGGKPAARPAGKAAGGKFDDFEDDIPF
jgi:hypothetical protein